MCKMNGFLDFGIPPNRAPLVLAVLPDHASSVRLLEVPIVRIGNPQEWKYVGLLVFLPWPASNRLVLCYFSLSKLLKWKVKPDMVHVVEFVVR